MYSAIFAHQVNVSDVVVNDSSKSSIWQLAAAATVFRYGQIYYGEFEAMLVLCVLLLLFQIYNSADFDEINANWCCNWNACIRQILRNLCSEDEFLYGVNSVHNIFHLNGFSIFVWQFSNSPSNVIITVTRPIFVISRFAFKTQYFLPQFGLFDGFSLKIHDKTTVSFKFCTDFVGNQQNNHSRMLRSEFVLFSRFFSIFRYKVITSSLIWTGLVINIG